MPNVNLVSFLDAVQRTIIGELVVEAVDSEFLVVKNPVVVNIIEQTRPQMRQIMRPQLNPQGQPTGRMEPTGQMEPTGMSEPTGQMALQLLPVYFREFQGEKKNPAIFKYRKSQITSIDFEGGFDFRLYGQYEHIFSQANVQPDPKAPVAAPVLKLFEEKV